MGIIDLKNIHENDKRYCEDCGIYFKINPFIDECICETCEQKRIEENEINKTEEDE